MIEYKGYSGVLEFDPSIGAFHGRVVGLQDVVTFQGHSLDELRREMAESVDDYLELCAEVGKDPERPYRGEFLVRTTPELHRAAATEAETSGLSLNAWVEAAIETIVKERRSSAMRTPEAGKTGGSKKRPRGRSTGSSRGAP
jgi:predicted HicB family RNase H-like nuclease